MEKHQYGPLKINVLHTQYITVAFKLIHTHTHINYALKGSVTQVLICTVYAKSHIYIHFDMRTACSEAQTRKQDLNLITATHPLTQDHNQVSACSVRLPAGDIHHGSQFEQLCDEEAQI